MMCDVSVSPAIKSERRERERERPDRVRGIDRANDECQRIKD